MAVSTATFSQDKQQFRDQAKALEAHARGLGEPKDRCSIGVYLTGNGVVARTFTATDLMPGDKFLTVNGVDVSAMGAEEIIALLRDIQPSAVIPVIVERKAEFVDVNIACSNARAATEALLHGLDLAGRGKFDDCVAALSERKDLGTEGAAVKAQCASLSRGVSRHDAAVFTLDAMRMAIEDARWAPDTRPGIIQGLRASEGLLTRELGPARFQELVTATRDWPGAERMYDAAAPDWVLFRRNSEAALRARLIDPESARIEWPHGFLYGWWKPVLSKRVEGYWTCGSINARNRLGGYTGSTSFVVVLDHSGTVQFSDIGESKDFDLVTTQCANSVKLLPPPPPEFGKALAAQEAPRASIADELAKLVDLKNSGALTEAEFQTAKQRLLGASGQH